MARLGGAHSSSFSSPSSFSNSSVFQNHPLISALVAFALAQSTKFFTTWYKERRWDPKRLVGSGGMPSSHSATVTALAIAVGFHDGFGSSLFAAALVFACIVMHDAFGVRLHAGKQAEVLNQIVFELPAEHPLAETRPLRELLGHTPAQGFVLLILLAVVIASSSQHGLLTATSYSETVCPNGGTPMESVGSNLIRSFL